MKLISRLFVALISLAAVGFLGIFIFAPEKGVELQDRIADFVTQRSEAIEVSPVRTLEVAYEFDVEEILDQGCNTNYNGKVYTWFRDLNRDLWLPFINDDRIYHVLGDVVICDREGIVKRLETCTGDSNTWEFCIPAGALADLPEGDYWVAFRVIPEIEIENFTGPWYELRYISIHDQCTFHTEDYDIAAALGNRLYDRSTGEGYTFHLLNLGDNIVTDVWKLEYSMTLDGELAFTQKKLTEGKEYALSNHGADVTLTPDYLNSLIPVYGYNFEFGLGDHSSLITEYAGEGGAVLYLADGPLENMPYIEGPWTYSLSSGKDYAFTIHMGRAIQMWAPLCELIFFDPKGRELLDENGEPISWHTFRADGVRADGTYVIPASVFQEAAAHGTWDSFYLSICFQVSDFSYSGYYPRSGYSVHLAP